MARAVERGTQLECLSCHSRFRRPTLFLAHLERNDCFPPPAGAFQAALAAALKERQGKN